MAGEPNTTAPPPAVQPTAGGPPAPVPAPQPTQTAPPPQRAGNEDQWLMPDTRLELEDGVVTIADLIDARKKLKDLGDPDAAIDLVKATTGNDPEARKRILKRELDALNAQAAAGQPVNTTEVTALKQELAAVRQELAAMRPAVDAINTTSQRAVMKNLLSDARLKAQYPFLTHDVDGGAVVAERHLAQLRHNAAARGVSLDNRPDLLAGALKAANDELSNYARMFGVSTLPGTTVTPANPNPNVTVTGGNGALPAREGIVSARMTVNDLLGRPNQGVPQPAPVAGRIPETGGTLGAPLAPVAAPTGRMNREGLIAAMRARREQIEGVQ